MIPLPRKLLHAVCCFHFNDALQKNHIYYGMTLTVYLIWQSVTSQLWSK